MKSQFSPMKRQYFYLHSEMAEIRADPVRKYSFKWDIPSQDIKNSELSIKSLHSTNAEANTKYVIRTSLNCDNVYDSLFGDPIVSITNGLWIENDIQSPILQITNTVCNSITLSISDSFTNANRDRGIPLNVDFVICLELTDYIPEEKKEFYTTNKQRIDLPNY